MKCSRCGKEVAIFLSSLADSPVCFDCVNYNGGIKRGPANAGVIQIVQSFADWSNTHDCTGCKHFNGFNEWGPNCGQCARSKCISDFYEVVR